MEIFSRKSSFGKKLLNNQLDLPKNRRLPNGGPFLPCFLVGDAAFPLHTTLMKPYPGRGDEDVHDAFSYRLSRGRRCVENCFGIASAKFRLLRREMMATRENAVWLVKAICVLHNYLRSDKLYCPPGFADSEIKGK